ncbi:MAG: 50S ribosomal protein L24 [Bacteroidetes bacterium]|nr:50S ribosomal protein L24 [Bacteroidota bacterium]
MVKKGDKVKILTGGDKGKTGNVLRVFRDENKVIVEGINISKIHKKKTSSKPGQIIEMAMPIHISNVAVVK